MNDIFKNFLTRDGIKFRDKGVNVGDTFINICCIFCLEKKFHLGISLEKGFFLCFVCDFKGGLKKIINALVELTNNLNYYSLLTKEKSYFLEKEVGNKIICPVDKKIVYPLNENTKKYLHGDVNIKDLKAPFRCRGIKDLKGYEVFSGVGFFSGYVVFKEGLNFIGRSMYSGRVKWKKQIVCSNFVFGLQEAKKRESKRIFLVEGIFDLLRLPWGECVALLGGLSKSKLNKIIKELPFVKEIFLCLDGDVVLNKNLLYSLTDVFKVEIFDWSLIRKKYNLNKQVKDLDELFLIIGSSCLKIELKINEIAFLSGETMEDDKDDVDIEINLDDKEPCSLDDMENCEACQ